MKHMTSLFAAVGLLLAAGSSWAADKVVFGTNWLAQGGHGGFYQAVVDGTYAKYGLDVEIRMGGPQVNTRPMLPAGRLDFLMGGNLLLAFDNVRNGIPTTVVAAIFQKDPQAFMAHKGEYADFAALTKAPSVLVSKDGQFSFWQWMVTRLGFQDEQLRPYGFNLAQFLSDKKMVQQAYGTAEPLYAAKEGAEVDVFLLADQGWSTYGSIIAANPEMTVEKLDAEMAQFDKLQIIDSGEAVEKGIGAMSPERIKAFHDLAVESKIIEAGAVDLSKVADTRFVNKGMGLDIKAKLTGK